MEAVEDQPDVRVVGAPDHLPGVTMVVDEPPPGERFISHANLALRGPFAKRHEIVGRSIDAAKRCR